MADELFLKTTIREVLAAFSQGVEEKTGRPFIDFKWPNRLIYFHLINQRADIYYQTRKQNNIEGNYEDYTEVLPCVAMQEIDLVECPCAPPSGCTFMKSVLPLPKFVGASPISVTTVDGRRRFDRTEWEYFPYEVNNRIAAANKSLLYTDRTIGNERWLYTFITNEMKPQGVMVAGIPVDPMEVALYPICGKEQKEICNILDLQFIIEKRLTNLLFDTTFKKLIGINNATRIGDTKNDNRSAETSPDPRY